MSSIHPSISLQEYLRQNVITNTLINNSKKLSALWILPEFPIKPEGFTSLLAVIGTSFFILHVNTATDTDNITIEYIHRKNIHIIHDNIQAVLKRNGYDLARISYLTN